MRYSLTIGHLFGVAVRLHVTFLLFVLLIGGFTFARAGSSAAIMSVGLISLSFACVVFHEFGHILAARRYGVRTRDVVLLPIGGMALMERMPVSPLQEIVVALAGPAVNVVIAAVLFIALGGFPTMNETMQPTLGGLASQLLYANVLLVVFNMIPAFPMDGGRVLRALLAMWQGHGRATTIASRIGQGLAVLFGLAALATGNLILLLVGVFIFFAASSENRAASMEHAAVGMTNGDAMITHFAKLSRDSTLVDAVDCRLRSAQDIIPVCGSDGRLTGVVSRRTIFDQLKKHGPQWPVVEVMNGNVPEVHVEGDLQQTMQIIFQDNHPAVGVVDDQGRLVGLVTRATLEDLLAIRETGHTGANGRPGNLLGDLKA